MINSNGTKLLRLETTHILWYISRFIEAEHIIVENYRTKCLEKHTFILNSLFYVALVRELGPFSHERQMEFWLRCGKNKTLKRLAPMVNYYTDLWHPNFRITLRNQRDKVAPCLVRGVNTKVICEDAVVKIVSEFALSKPVLPSLQESLINTLKGD
jgi:hypothetical protein